MTMLRPFRFSAVLDQARSQRSESQLYADAQFAIDVDAAQTWSREGLIAKARWIEDLGYTTLLVPDHPWLDIAPIPTLMAVAENTSLRIGTHVLNLDVRHPALLAKDIAMLDVLSHGRVECGLGCGAIVDDYIQTGLLYDRPAVRVSRFEEALHILKRFFMEETVNFSGQYYQVTGLKGTPKPCQKPHPPLYIGGGGKRVLSLAAREADIVGLAARSTANGIDWASATHQPTLEKLIWLQDEAGERFRNLEFSVSLFVVVPTENREEVAQHMAPRFGLTPQQLLSCTHMLIGTIDQMVEELLRRREIYGISAIAVIESSAAAFAPLVAALAGK